MSAVSIKNTLRNPCIFALLALLVLVFLLNAVVENGSAVLGLLPANTLLAHKYIWNLLTSCFYEKDVLKVVVDIAALFLVVLRHGITIDPFIKVGSY